ncbi:MAG: META domain-containing protein [Candidatus Cryptobacteroides sp.]
MKKFLLIAVFAACVAGLVSCGSEAPDVAGRWDVVSIGDKAVVEYDPMHGPALIFDCEAGRVHGFTGVNLVNGSFTKDGSVISFGEMATTMMAGPLEAMEQERAFLEAVEAAVKVVPVKGGIAFRDENGKEVMRLAAHVTDGEPSSDIRE